MPRQTENRKAVHHASLGEEFNQLKGKYPKHYKSEINNVLLTFSVQYSLHLVTTRLRGTPASTLVFITGNTNFYYRLYHVI